MNVEEQVATLEALLARVKKNAAMPRALHRADVGAPHARTPIAAGSAGEPAAELVGAKPAPAEIAPKPVEVTPRPAPVEIAVKPVEPVAEKPHKGMTTTLMGPGTPKPPVEPVVARAAAKPVEAPAKPVEKAEPAKPVVAAPAARTPAPVVARPAVPKPADAGTPRTPPVAPARPAVGRPPLPSRPPVEPAAQAAAEKAELGLPFEPIRAEEPPRVEPVRATEKAEAAPIKAAEKPASTLKAPGDDELLFNFDTDEPAKRPEPVAAKPVEKAAEKPVEKVAEKPVEKRVELRPAPSHEEEEATDDETKLMVGPIPDAARQPPGDEITVDDDTHIVTGAQLAKAAEKPPIAAASDENEEPESEEVTRLMEPGERISMPKLDGDRGSSPKIEPAPKVVVERPVTPKIEGEKVVVSQAARPPVKVEEPAPPVREAPPVVREAAPIAPVVAQIPSAIIEDHPPEIREHTSPSRRYEPTAEEVRAGNKPPSRAPLWGLAIAAVLLLGAGVAVGLRNGWFDSSGTTGPGPSALPPTSAVPAVKDSASAGTLTAPPVVTVAESASAAPAPSAPPSESAVPAASASAAPATSASAPPAVSASAEPAVKPPPDGDGSALAPGKGYLIVTSAKPAGVFLTGVFVGRTGEKIEVECGAKFLRLGVAPADGAARPAEVTWISEGKSAAVGCMKTTNITLEAK